MRLAVAVIALVIVVQPGVAQTLSGVRVGDKISAEAIASQKPIRISRSGPFNIQKWKLEDGNDLSVTSYASDGRIVYAETDWNGQVSGSISDFSGIVYGKTNLADLVRRFNSHGIIFRDHFIFPGENQSLVRFNTYNIEGQDKGTVTFASRISKQDISALTTQKLNESLDKWKVESIIIADETYIAKIWGSTVSIDKQNRPITWETPQ